jgi:hypothetical protein
LDYYLDARFPEDDPESQQKKYFSKLLSQAVWKNELAKRQGLVFVYLTNEVISVGGVSLTSKSPFDPDVLAAITQNSAPMETTNKAIDQNVILVFSAAPFSMHARNILINNGIEIEADDKDRKILGANSQDLENASKIASGASTEVKNDNRENATKTLRSLGNQSGFPFTIPGKQAEEALKCLGIPPSKFSGEITKTELFKILFPKAHQANNANNQAPETWGYHKPLALILAACAMPASWGTVSCVSMIGFMAYLINKHVHEFSANSRQILELALAPVVGRVISAGLGLFFPAIDDFLNQTAAGSVATFVVK